MRDVPQPSEKRRLAPPPTLRRVEIRGFKSYVAPTPIELRALTLLVGANSSGKSSALQPLLLLKQSDAAAVGDSPRLRLAGANVTFTDARQFLSTKLGSPNKRGGVFEYSVELTNDMEIRTAFLCTRTAAQLSGLSLRAGKRVVSLRFQEGKWKIVSTSPEIAEPERLRVGILRGLFPEVMRRIKLSPRSGQEVLVDLWDEVLEPHPYPTPPTDTLRFLLDRLVYLPGLRGNPGRFYPVTSVPGRVVPGPYQEYVASIVASWTDSNDPRLARLAAAARRLGLTWRVQGDQVDASATAVRVGRTSKPARGGAKDVVSIADVGLGMSQVLPVLVALIAARPGTTVYVEQPEIHLHPRAQAALVDVFADAVGRGVQLIVETHSLAILLGVQTAVARGQISPGSAAVNWFERDADGYSVVRHSPIDETGAMGSVPDDFADALAEQQLDFIQASHAAQSPARDEATLDSNRPRGD